MPKKTQDKALHALDIVVGDWQHEREKFFSQQAISQQFYELDYPIWK
ncbi:MAG: hypothetical protein JRH20_08270 [Deltaproteobacteria bacterium]|nr:hypothetical protein [Deltaproteobacteria bacterium]